MNRFPQHYHERAEQPLRCHQCNNALSERESDHYWNSHLLGQGDPYCFDCVSQIDLEEVVVIRKPKPVPVVPLVLFGAAIGCVLIAIGSPEMAGYCILAAVGCGSLGLTVKICGR